MRHPGDRSGRKENEKTYEGKNEKDRRRKMTDTDEQRK